MAETPSFYKPSLTMRSGDTSIPFNSVKFDSSAAGVSMTIQTSEAPAIIKDDLIEGIFSWGGGLEAQLFLCQVIDVYPDRGGTFKTLCRERWFNELSSNCEPVTWRKTNVPEILRDLFEMAGVTDIDLSSCAVLNVSRFSCPAGHSGYITLSRLKELVRAAYGLNYQAVISPTGIMSFGDMKDIRPEMPETINFTSGQNILTKERDRIEAFASPVVYGQAVQIDGVKAACIRSIITISPGKYRMTLEAAAL